MKIINLGVKEFYEKVGTYFSHTRKWLWPEMLPYLNRIKPSDTVLDIGCGNGRLIQGLPPTCEYVGMDFSRLLLGKAKILHPTRKFVYGDVLSAKAWKKLPKGDALFCVAMIHHIPPVSLEFVFSRMKDKVQSNGFLYISTWNLWQFSYLKHHFSKNSLIAKWRTKSFRSVLVPFQKRHERYCVAYSAFMLKKVVRKVGFTVEKTFYSESNSMLFGKNVVLILKV